jgi:flagellar operon protein
MSDLIHPVRPIITGRPGVTPPGQKPQTQSPAAQPEQSFRELLGQSIRSRTPQTLTFSRHAQLRTQERNISLSASDLNRLDEAVGKAEEKGLTDTLVFMNNTAFIVNIPNRVVVTVVDGSDTEPVVFTNIDGAVMV